MNLKASVLYALRIIFPRGSKKTVGSKSIVGAIVCIALSLIPLVVVLSAAEGITGGITERIINLSSSHIQVVYDFSYEEKIDIDLMKIASERISEIDGVKHAETVITSNALASSSKARSGAMIRAVEPESILNNPDFLRLISTLDGDISDFGKTKNALVGKGIADNLNLKAGDTLRLITTQKQGNKIFPKFNSFKIAAVISSGYQELDALWVYIPLKEGLSILKPEVSECTILVSTTKPLDKLYSIQNKIDEAVMYEASTYRWDEVNKSQMENFTSTKMLLEFIMILIVLIACVNISSCLVMITIERRKEIAILKSVGTDRNTIVFSFVTAGFIIGLSGILIGIPSGILISLNVNSLLNILEKTVNFFAQILYFIQNGNVSGFNFIHLMDEAYYLEKIPVQIPGKEIILYILITLVLSVLASLVPALKAGKEKTMETFRKAGV